MNLLERRINSKPKRKRFIFDSVGMAALIVVWWDISILLENVSCREQKGYSFTLQKG